MVTPYLLVIILLRILLLRILPLAVTQYTTTSLEPACCTEQDATEPDLPPEDEGIPWLPARILEIPLSYLLRSATEGYPVLGESFVHSLACLICDRTHPKPWCVPSRGSIGGVHCLLPVNLDVGRGDQALVSFRIVVDVARPMYLNA